MKRCPECRRDYYDETLLYCLEDGTALVSGLPDEPATAILGKTDGVSDRRTQAELHTTDQTAVLPSRVVPAPKSGFNKRLLLAPALLGIIVLGGFILYRYVNPVASGQINSIAVFRSKIAAAGFELRTYAGAGEGSLRPLRTP